MGNCDLFPVIPLVASSFPPPPLPFSLSFLSLANSTTPPPMGSGSSKGAKRRAQTSSSLALKPSTSAPSHAPSTSSSSPTLQSQPSTSNAKKTPKKAHQESGDTFNQKHAEEFFKKYADDDAIGPDGMTRMCADWGIEPEDVVLLVVSFYMGAQDQGYFTRDEFLNGMRKLEIDSMTKLKA